MRNIFKFSLIVLLSIPSCGKDDDDAAVVSELVGTWATACHEDDGSWYTGTTTLTATTVSGSTKVYQEAACTTAVIEAAITGTWTSAGTVTTPAGAKKFDVIYSTLSFTVLTDEYVTSANEDSYYEFSDWVKNTAKNISGKKFSTDSTTDSVVTIGDTYYDIYKITDKTLCYSVDSDDETEGSTEAKRPTTLEPTAQCATKS